MPLSTTVPVAQQQDIFIAKQLNGGLQTPFKYL
jgi:hypothetical protein